MASWASSSVSSPRADQRLVIPPDLSSRVLTRRHLLLSAAAAAGTLSLSACSDAAERLVAPAGALSDRKRLIAAQAQIEHVVVVMMENRSFDHLLGWLPRADARQTGLVYLDREGQPQHTYGLAPDFQGCGLSDPDHSFDGGRIERRYDPGNLFRMNQNVRPAVG